MFTKLGAIAVNTFIETIRQPIYGILLWVAIGLLLLNPGIAAFSLESGSDTKILRDIALSTMLLFGLLASVFSASGVISREIESLTVLTVVSKPVGRPTFLIGKYVGVAAAMATAFYILVMVLLMTVRHGVMETNADKYDWPVIVLGVAAIAISVAAAGFGNFTYGWHFSATLIGWIVPLGTVAVIGALCFGRAWEPQPITKDFGDMQLLYACLLIFMAVLILTAFAVALATRFGQVVTLLLCSAIFVGGLMSDYYFGLRAEQGWIFRVAYALAPNFQFFWINEALTQGLLVTGAHVLNVAAHAGLYALAVLSVGVAMFQTREVG